MRKTTRAKYKAVQARYQVLYKKQRIRHDDVIQMLQEEFFLSEQRIYKILRIELEDEEEEERELCNIRSS